MKQYPSTSAASSLQPPAAVRPKHLGKHLLAQRMRAARMDAGLTQKEVAADADTNRPNVTLWEDPEAPHAPSTLHVMEMRDAARSVGLAVVRVQADALDAAVYERPEVVEDCPEARAGRVVVQCLAVPSALAARRADGIDEPHEVLSELDKTRALVTTLQEHEAYLVALHQRLLRHLHR